MTTELTTACSWYEYRINVVPWGERMAHTPSRFVDTLETARAIKADWMAQGADDVHIYDTVEGVFYQ
jgi:hypothetical protein